MTVYPRDASWHDRPGHAHAYHAPDDPQAPTWAACAPGRIVLWLEGGIPAAEAPALCRRSACVRAREDAPQSSGGEEPASSSSAPSSSSTTGGGYVSGS